MKKGLKDMPISTTSINTGAIGTSLIGGSLWSNFYDEIGVAVTIVSGVIGSGLAINSIVLDRKRAKRLVIEHDLRVKLMNKELDNDNADK